MLLEAIYRFGLGLDRKLTKPLRLPRPVVSVGNIAVGGRAKTPLVILLAQKLAEWDFVPVVLTRGYGRRTRKPVVLRGSPGSAVSAADAGDEALEIFWSCGVEVRIGPNRSASAHAALADAKHRERVVFLLDDGFQHWRLDRDLDVVVVSEADFGGRLLPVGRLRESATALNRADVVLELGKDLRKVTELRTRPESGQWGVLSTRAPDPHHRAQVESVAPIAEWRALPDHAPLARMELALGASPLREWVVGAKEAVKLLDAAGFARLVDQGRCEWKGKLLHYAACRLELAEPKVLFDALRKAVEGES